MYCLNCGKKIKDGEVYCSDCDYKITEDKSNPSYDKNKTAIECPWCKSHDISIEVSQDGGIWQVISLVITIVGLCFTIIGIPFAILLFQELKNESINREFVCNNCGERFSHIKKDKINSKILNSIFKINTFILALFALIILAIISILIEKFF